MFKKEKSQMDLTQELLEATRCRVKDLTKINTMQGTVIEDLTGRLSILESAPILPYPYDETGSDEALLGDMRTKKIASMEKSIAKFKNLTF